MSARRSVLFVMGTFARGRAHALLGTGRGLDASFAEGALSALTRLERDRPDLVVCDESLGDMGGADLLDILRNDPATARCPFLLIAREKPAHFGGPLDLWHAPGLSPQELVGVVLGHLEELPREEPTAPLAEAADPGGEAPLTDDLLLDDGPDDGAAPEETADEGGAGLQGTLELIGLFDLLTFFNQMRKSGRLFVHLGETAQLVLDGGQVVWAEHGGLSGEAAFHRTYAATEATPGAPFTFHPLRQGEVRDLPHTITTPTQHLMLEATVQLDHAQAPHR